MSAQLLYKMIKSKTEYPLHKAIKVEREDVVFLYLIEMDSQVLHLLFCVLFWFFFISHAFPQTILRLFFSIMHFTSSELLLVQFLVQYFY